MFGVETINQMNKKAAKKAIGKQPYVAKCDGDAGVRAMPNFGDYRPIKWELLETHFVDSSGFGSSSEPALTLGQFLGKVKKGLGYALIEQGQFQVYIGEFSKV